MPVPNSELCFVAPEKITEYLLSDTHVLGREKAKFFTAFGFHVGDVDTFRDALIQHGIVRDVHKEDASPYGVKYKLLCEIQTPDNRNPCIATVWIIDKGTVIPKLITAYPL